MIAVLTVPWGYCLTASDTDLCTLTSVLKRSTVWYEAPKRSKSASFSGPRATTMPGLSGALSLALNPFLPDLYDGSKGSSLPACPAQSGFSFELRPRGFCYGYLARPLGQLSQHFFGSKIVQLELEPSRHIRRALGLCGPLPSASVMDWLWISM